MEILARMCTLIEDYPVHLTQDGGYPGEPWSIGGSGSWGRNSPSPLSCDFSCCAMGHKKEVALKSDASFASKPTQPSKKDGAQSGTDDDGRADERGEMTEEEKPAAQVDSGAEAKEEKRQPSKAKTKADKYNSQDTAGSSAAADGSKGSGTDGEGKEGRGRRSSTRSSASSKSGLEPEGEGHERKSSKGRSMSKESTGSKQEERRSSKESKESTGQTQMEKLTKRYLKQTVTIECDRVRLAPVLMACYAATLHRALHLHGKMKSDRLALEFKKMRDTLLPKEHCGAVLKEFDALTNDNLVSHLDFQAFLEATEAGEIEGTRFNMSFEHMDF